MSRLTMIITGLAILSAVAAGDRVANALTPDELQKQIERVAPPYPTLPAKVPCACPQTGYLSRAVGYLNSFVNDHFGYTTVDVWCAYQGFLPDGRPAFQTACADYELLK